MIEHMKSFVNEHHTLIVVIISVLFVCFLYWYFCCKDKIKGGKASCAGVEISGLTTDNNYNIIKSQGCSNALGLKLMNPLPILNLKGEKYMKELNDNKRIYYLIYVMVIRYRVDKIADDPLSYIINRNHDLDPSPEKSQKNKKTLKNYEFKNVQETLLNYNVNNFVNYFDFEEIINNFKNDLVDINSKKRIKYLYNRLIELLMNDPNIDFAEFIGQLSRNINPKKKETASDFEITEEMDASKYLNIVIKDLEKPYCNDEHEEEEGGDEEEENDDDETRKNCDAIRTGSDLDKKIEALTHENIFDNDVSYILYQQNGKDILVRHPEGNDGFIKYSYNNESNGRKTVLSPNYVFVKKNNNNIIKLVYGETYNNIRSWYARTKWFYENFCGYSSYKDTIEFVDEYKTKSSKYKYGKSKAYEFADIYPAQKVSMMIIYLYLYFSYEDDEMISDLDEIIAVFVLYVHLFNQFCFVLMEKQWNGIILNEYVYVKNDNVLKKNIYMQQNEEEIERIFDDQERFNPDYFNLRYSGNKILNLPIDLQKKFNNIYSNYLLFNIKPEQFFDILEVDFSALPCENESIDFIINRYEENKDYIYTSIFNMGFRIKSLLKKNINPDSQESQDDFSRLEKDINKKVNDLKNECFEILDIKMAVEYGNTISKLVSIEGYNSNTRIIKLPLTFQKYINKGETIYLLFNDKNNIENLCILQNFIQTFVINDDKVEENFENIRSKIVDQRHVLTTTMINSILSFLNYLSLNHVRYNNFFGKIERLIIFLLKEFKYDQKNLFNIFQNNKKVLLFLFNDKYINVDIQIYNEITKRKHFKLYFYNEIKSFDQAHTITSIDESYEVNRKNGENDDYICKLIRDDIIDEFIKHVNKNNIPANEIIKKSNYETNSMLINKEVSLIEYAAFFGAIKIFKYIKSKLTINLKPDIWVYAIHSNNFELINYIDDELHIKPNVQNALETAIKCFCAEIFDFLVSKYLDKDKKSEIMKNCEKYCRKYYNFTMFLKITTEIEKEKESRYCEIF